MTDLMWRNLMFLIGCMGTRFGLALLAYKINPTYLPYMGIVALGVAIGFALIYIKGWRKTGGEVRGSKIWWNALRPVHASLWFAFAIMAFAQNKHAWVPLLLDALLGLVAFTVNRISAA